MKDDKLFPPTELKRTANWAEKLYTAGLFLFAFTCNFSISAAQISLGLALIGCMSLYCSGKIKLKATPLDKPFAFLAFTGLLSIFRAEDLSIAIPEMKNFLLIFCFYLSYWYEMSEERQKNLVLAFVLSATLIAIISSFRAVFLEPPGYRAQGFYSMSMTFGECQALAVLIAITLFGFFRNGYGRQALLIIATISSACSVLFSMVRSAWLGLFFGVTILFIRFPKRTALISFIIVAAILPFIIANPTIQDRFLGFDPSMNAQTAEKKVGDLISSDSLRANHYRMTTWWRGFQIFENQYAFGVGLNNVKPWYARLATEFEFEKCLIFGHQHNNFMQILVTSGFIGLIAFFNFIIAGLIFFWKSSKADPENLSHTLMLGSSAIFVCFLTFGVGEFSWGDAEVSMMALFLTGLMMNRTGNFYEPTGSEFVATAS